MILRTLQLSSSYFLNVIRSSARTPQARLWGATCPRYSPGSRNLGQSSDSIANRHSLCH
ncbi:UNVERIFIED_CONTAM: hypothetical protein Sradi_4135500 [Sesamum radiatum]|uniref:Uncharacterized protein n=1 Tax=Sesamum radiatum TaxID=300843 RepID=A0AAW2P3E5_SESRA